MKMIPKFGLQKPSEVVPFFVIGNRAFKIKLINFQKRFDKQKHRNRFYRNKCHANGRCKTLLQKRALQNSEYLFLIRGSKPTQQIQTVIQL